MRLELFILFVVAIVASTALGVGGYAFMTLKQKKGALDQLDKTNVAMEETGMNLQKWGRVIEIENSKILAEQKDMNKAMRAMVSRYPDVKQTTLFDNRAGPYPVSTTFSSRGGTLVFVITLSGWSTKVGSQVFTFSIDGTAAHTYTTFYNTTAAHMGWAVSFMVIDLAAGTHTLNIVYSGSSDANDHVDGMVTEYKVLAP
ncbi:hypothetical protein HDV00_012586 [Rhizophlyctis rosea]|nr:hypothetical protein HDV00_012586 [Rhizophlyctis rosea]